MKISIKLLILTLVLISKNIFTLELTEQKKIKDENSETKVKKINKYRDESLKKYFPNVLSTLIQKYDPIEYEWICEQKFDSNIPYLLTISPDGHLLAFTSTKTMTVFNMETNANIQTRVSDENYTALCMLPENKLATSSYYKEIKIWNLHTNQRKKTISNNEIVFALCSLPENKLALGGNYTIQICNIHTSECEKTIFCANTVSALCLLSKNKLISGHKDGTIKIWDLEKCECENTIKKNSNRILSLCLLSENKLVSGHNDGTIKIWDLKTNECENTINGHSFGVHALCLLPGKKLASGSHDGTTKIWSNQAYSLNIPDENPII